MSVRHIHQTAPLRHFAVLSALTPSNPPSPDDRLDRLLRTVDALACCPSCSHRWINWILEGRFGKDYPAALERLVLELAMQHGREIGQ